MYVKVFICLSSDLEDEVDKWLDFMREDGNEVTIINATQSQDNSGVVTLVLFCK